MSKHEEASALLCARVSELDDAPPVESVVDSCCKCGCAVWRALSSPKEPPAMCGQCALMVMQFQENIVIGPLTDEQRTELAAHGIKYRYEG